MIRDDLARLAEISLRMASIVDRKGESGKHEYLNELGYGYLALSSCLRAGVKAIADIQMDLANARSDAHLARVGKESMREFLTDIFGDEEPETLNEEYKNRIREFVQELLKEMNDDD